MPAHCRWRTVDGNDLCLLIADGGTVDENDLCLLIADGGTVDGNNLCLLIADGGTVDGNDLCLLIADCGTQLMETIGASSPQLMSRHRSFPSTVMVKELSTAIMAVMATSELRSLCVFVFAGLLHLWIVCVFVCVTLSLSLSYVRARARVCVCVCVCV